MTHSSRSWQRLNRRGAVLAAFLLIAGVSTGDTVLEEPLLRFSTYIGGDEADLADAAAFGPDGALWVFGTSYSQEIGGARRVVRKGSREADLFLLRLDTATHTVLSTIWLGGTGSDDATALAFDASGNAYIAGSRGAADFPVTRGTAGAGPFVARVLPNGSGFAWVFGLGGSADDRIAALAVTGDGDPVVVGTVQSPEFPLVAPLRSTIVGNRDAFVARLRADGSSIVFSTLLGGSNLDDAFAVGIAPDGAILVGGWTNSPDFADVRLFGNPSIGLEGFLAEIDPAGAAVHRVRRLGRTQIAAISTDAAGSLLVLGQSSDTLPIALAPHAPRDEYLTDAFLMRLDAATWLVSGGTFFGGSDREYYLAMDAAPDGTVWVTGSNTSSDLPVPGAVRPLLGSSEDAFVAAFEPNDFSLRFATHLGGDARELGYAIAVAADGSAGVAGATVSTNFPPVHPIEIGTGSPRGDHYDVYIAQVIAGEPAIRPAAPTGVAAQALPEKRVRVTWAAIDPAATGVGVDRSDGTGFTRIALVEPETKEWIDPTVGADRTYTYAVQAFNAGGGSPVSALVEVTSPATIDVEILSGRFRLMETWFEPIGVLRLQGTLGPEPPLRGIPNPRASGVTIALSTANGLPVQEVVIAAGNAGWRLRRNGHLHWRGRSTQFEFDPATGEFDLRRVATAFAPPERVQVTIGRDSGSALPAWRRTEHLKFRVP